MLKLRSKLSNLPLRAAALVLLSVGGGVGASAQAPLILEVLLNGRTAPGMGTFAQLDDGQIAATRASLAEIGVKAPDGSGDELIPLDGIPDLSYVYDVPEQRIRITASDARQIARRYDAASPVSHVDEAQSDYGMVFNYTLYGTTVEHRSASGLLSQFGGKAALSKFFSTGLSGFVDGRAFTPFGVMRQSNIVRAQADGSLEHLRLDTSVTHYDAERALTYTGGDVITSGPAWARPIRVGGIQVRRSFDLRPDLVTLPLPSTEGSAAVPSTVEVYLNGLKTFSQTVDAGPYRLQNLPVIGRGGTAQVIVRDAMGREVQTNLPFFVSSALLAPGILDFSLQAGLPRLFYATERDSYVNLPVGVGSVRYGLADGITVQGHGETGAGLVNGGLGAAFRLGSYGVLTGTGAASQVDARTGYQGGLSFEGSLGGVSFFGSTLRTFGDFQDLASITARTDRAARFKEFKGGFRFADPVLNAGSLVSVAPARSIDQVSISAPVPFDKSYVGASLIQRVDASGVRARLVSASWSRPLWNNASVYVSAYKDFGDRPQTGIVGGFSMALGSDISASVTATQTEKGPVIATNAVKGLKPEPGSYGWRIQDVEGQTQNRSGAVAYRSSFGRVEAGAAQRRTGTQASLEFEGAVGLIGFAPFMANRIDDAFAVVDAGVSGVQVFHENRPVAKTDWTGRAVIPNLRSFDKSRIAIDPSNLPLDANVAQTEHTLVPRRLSGLKLDFGVNAAGQSAVVMLVAPGGAPLPAGLQGRSVSGGSDFVTGYDGQSFIANLAAENTVTVELPRGACTATFPYARSADQQVTIGPVVCQ